jgi:hypothetical protein
MYSLDIYGPCRAAQHSKREHITKIIGVSSGTTYVYIVVTKYISNGPDDLECLTKVSSLGCKGLGCYK